MRWTNEQNSIISSPVENACVIACAGAGKTAVIVERLTRLVTTGQFSVNEVAVITFTNKAAEELEFRLQTNLDTQEIKGAIWSSTIHSFCLKLLKDFDPEYGERVRILTEGRQYALLSRNYFEWELDKIPLRQTTQTGRIEVLVKTLDIVKLERVNIEEWRAEYPELFTFIGNYENWMTENNYLDFTGILQKMVLALRNDDFRDNLFGNLKYLVIDEYQDTDPLQAAIVSLISSGIKIMVVGDDDQCIYQFRGTNVENILRFSKEISEVHQYFISNNFRCRKNILVAGNKLVSSIDKRIPKQINGFHDGGNILIKEFDSIEDEAQFLCDKIKYLRSSQAVNTYSNIAILFRSVSSSHRVYVEKMNENQIPYQILGDKALAEQPEISDIIGVLAFIGSGIIDANSVERLFGIFRSPVESISFEDDEIDLEDLSDLQWKTIGLCGTDVKILKKVLSIREIYRKQKFGSMLELYNLVLERLLFSLDKYDEIAIWNLAKLSSIIEEYDDIVESKRIEPLLIYLNTSGLRNSDTAAIKHLDREAVNVMTIHQAKGLEFEAVFCPMMVQGRFPVRGRALDLAFEDKDNRFHRYLGNIEDERRLFYVAITRGMSYVFLTYSKNIGLKREREPSEFTEKIRSFNTGPEIKIEKSLSKQRFKPLLTSYSQIEYYLSCPFRYKLSYIIGFKVPQSPFFTIGRAFHMILRMIHESYKSGNPMSSADAIGLLKENLSHVRNIPEIVIRRQQVLGEKAINSYLESKQDWLRNTLATEEPISFIQNFEDNDKSYRFMIRGQIDLIMNSNDGCVIVDFKTGKPQPYLRTDLQLQTYSLAMLNLNGIKPSRASVYYVTDDKEISYEVTDSWIESGKAIINEAVKGIMEKQYTANPGEVCRYCEVSAFCEYRSK